MGRMLKESDAEPPETTSFLGGIVARVGERPKFLINEKGAHFDCGGDRVRFDVMIATPREAARGLQHTKRMLEIAGLAPPEKKDARELEG